MENINMNDIYMTEKNMRGAWVVYGKIGIRQYYGYTKKDAIRLYREECKRTIFVNQSR